MQSRHAFCPVTMTSSRWPIMAGTPGGTHTASQTWLPAKYRSVALGANATMSSHPWKITGHTRFHVFPHLENDTAQGGLTDWQLWCVRTLKRKKDESLPDRISFDVFWQCSYARCCTKGQFTLHWQTPSNADNHSTSLLRFNMSTKTSTDQRQQMLTDPTKLNDKTPGPELTLTGMTFELSC